MPKTLSPRIRSSNSRDYLSEQSRKKADSPKRVMLNEKSSNSNFHEADDTHLSVDKSR